MNVYDGPLKIFITTNFADTYSPITATLINGAGEPFGHRTVNLLQSSPNMPTLQAMRKALAKHPMKQAELFLLLDELVHRCLLCATAFCGWINCFSERASPAKYDDDYASTGFPGIANFVRSLLKPLEAQGHGFSHGHEKVISVPRMRAARLKALFVCSAKDGTEDELGTWCNDARGLLKLAASTMNYDSATLSGRQMQVELLPEPFTNRQQGLSKFGGCIEADDTYTRHELIPVTEREDMGI